jgi:integrase
VCHKDTYLSNYIKKRNGVYYFHKRVNSNLANNKNHFIRKSLQTKCYTTAKKLSSLLNYCVNEYFELGKVMTNEEMEKIIYNFYDKSIMEYSDLEELRHKKNSVEIKDKFYEGSTKKAILYHLKKHNKLDNKREFSKIKDYVDNQIIPISKIEEKDLEELQKEKKFYWELFKYYGEILKNDLALYEGNSVENSVKKYKKDKPKNNDVKNSFANNEIVEEDSFEEILDTYINYLMTKKKISKNTIEDYKPSFYLIKEVFPNKKFSEITTSDLEHLEYLISYLPTNRFKKEFTRNLNINEQVQFMVNLLENRKNGVFEKKYATYSLIKERTQNKHFEQISSFIDYVSKKYNFNSPLNEIVLKRYTIKSDSSTERCLLNDNEIKIIFNEFDYLNKKLLKTLKEDPLKIYGIFLIMYLGIRPIEAGQLMVNDLQHTKDKNENTIYYLRVSKENTSEDINLNGVKREKTDNAKRKLPLTDIFINDLKFLEFVKQRKKEKHNFIFVNEQKDLDIEENIKNTVRRCEEFFNSRLKKLKIEDLDKKSFYSLRHSFANKIKHIPETLKDKRGETLMGHSGATDSELFNRYGNKYFEPDFLYEILEKVEYSDMDLNFEKIQKVIK